MELLNLPADARSLEDPFSPHGPELEDPPEVAPLLELLKRAKRR